MRLKKIIIKNFRKFDYLEVEFPPGLSIIVGENNVGKTAVIDALRLMLFSSQEFDSIRVKEDDFRKGTDSLPIEISCIFSELTKEDEVRFLECLVCINKEQFEAKLNVKVEYNHENGKLNFKWWGGEVEGSRLPENIRGNISAIYLQPLRDPESGLRPNRYSQISRLIKLLTPEDKEEDFVAIARGANEEIKKIDSVSEAERNINDQISGISGDKLAQKVSLVFSDPTFSRIIAGIQPEIDDLSFTLNGLGYNNLIFIATTLSSLDKATQFSYRSILIEEPEAHLHPQLQILLLRYLSSFTSREDNKVQVFTSSHSPILASQSSLDSIIAMNELPGNKVVAVSIRDIEFNPKDKKKLTRYLDATRAELFFAKRILMVEGISEVLLIPFFAKALGGDIKESSVTVINVDGINFNAFLPLFGKDKLAIPVVILTDGDESVSDGDYSDSANKLKEQVEKIDNCWIEISEISFEYELAKKPKLLAYMVQALKAMHPGVGSKIESDILSLTNDIDKAEYFYEETFKNRKTSKGLFAQELLCILGNENAGSDLVPDYIKRALEDLDVIKRDNEKETT